MDAAENHAAIPRAPYIGAITAIKDDGVLAICRFARIGCNDVLEINVTELHRGWSSPEIELGEIWWMVNGTRCTVDDGGWWVVDVSLNALT